MNGAAGPGSPPGSGVRPSPRRARTIVTPMTTAAAAAVPGRHSTPGSLARQLAAQEALDVVARLVVGQLLRRVLHQVRRRAQQRPADAALAGDPTAADRIDDAAGGVRAVLDREAHLELDRGVAE